MQMKTEHPNFDQSPELVSGLCNRFTQPVVDVLEVLEILARQHSWLGLELRKSQTALGEATALGKAEAIRLAGHRNIELSSQMLLLRDLAKFITGEDTEDNPFHDGMNC